VFGLGHWEIIIILVFALLIFGRRLPEVARSLGKGIVEFKKGVRGIEDEVDQNTNQTTKKMPLPPPPGFPGAQDSGPQVDPVDPVDPKP
jgi:sec-independent protein translocase protein TatA